MASESESGSDDMFEDCTLVPTRGTVVAAPESTLPLFRRTGFAGIYMQCEM